MKMTNVTPPDNPNNPLEVLAYGTAVAADAFAMLLVAYAETVVNSFEVLWRAAVEAETRKRAELKAHEDATRGDA